MDTEKIKKLEEEIKNLHYNPPIKKHSFSNLDTKEFFYLFWDIHVKPVIEYSKKMAAKYNANLEAVWLAAILHDIARLNEEEPHDKVGAEKAYQLLVEKGFNKDLAEKVRDMILTHRCRNHQPENLEQKILASADAMAHFIPPFYLWIGKYSNQNFVEMLKKNDNKIERDYNQKIFFEDEKRMVENQYKLLKKWFNYEN